MKVLKITVVLFFEFGDYIFTYPYGQDLSPVEIKEFNKIDGFDYKSYYL